MFRSIFDGSQNEDPRESEQVWAWVSLLCAAVFLCLICWLFNQCNPAPNKFEQAVFYTIMLLIFLETFYAGWYRSE
jgi:apolipoprotein N-acyltransferase